MQLRLEIICPFHQHLEVLTLPESYSVDFSGEVPCGAERLQATLYIALTVGEVKELRLVKSPLLFHLYQDADPRPERELSAERLRASAKQPARRRAGLGKGASTPRPRSRRLGPG
jgi:hypothetical protein